MAHDDAVLSRLLFQSREMAQAYAETITARTGQSVQALIRLVAEIDGYRQAQGWNPDGFGGEPPDPAVLARRHFEETNAAIGFHIDDEAAYQEMADRHVRNVLAQPGVVRDLLDHYAVPCRCGRPRREHLPHDGPTAAAGCARFVAAP